MSKLFQYACKGLFLFEHILTHAHFYVRPWRTLWPQGFVFKAMTLTMESTCSIGTCLMLCMHASDKVCLILLPLGQNQYPIIRSSTATPRRNIHFDFMVETGRRITVNSAPMGHLPAILGHLLCPIDFDAGDMAVKWSTKAWYGCPELMAQSGGQSAPYGTCVFFLSAPVFDVHLIVSLKWWSTTNFPKERFIFKLFDALRSRQRGLNNPSSSLMTAGDQYPVSHRVLNIQG